ncbi:MAG: hypothetical protein RLZZ214_4195 [Verrucomicrobiota bacterium]|jgi:hypothetical protein
MNVLTSQDVALIGCCPCQPDACEAPRKECQSISVAASSADDDYTDDIAEWEAGGEVGDPPPEPEGYGDVAHGSWAPFVQPMGELTDEIPTLYRELTSVTGEVVYTGDIKFYYAISGSEYETSVNQFVHWTANGTGFDFTAIQRVYDFGIDIGADGGWAVRVVIEDEGTEGFPSIPAPFAWVETDPPESPPCTATLKIVVTLDRSAEDAGSAVDVPTLPITEDPEGDDHPDGWDAADDWQWTNLTEKTQDSAELGEGVDKDAVIARATEKMPVGWDDPDGDACSSSVVTAWPKIGDLLSGADPEADPPVAASWPACSSEELPISATGSATVTKARYRVGIPAGARWDATTAEWLAWDAAGEEDEERGEEPPKTTLDAAHAAWEIAHAAWTAADPDERGEEPLEPTKRTTYELQWDEVFFPAEWEAWKALKDAFDAATAAHAIWEDADPDDRGDEPIIPDDPGAEPTAPSLVTSRSWVYAADEWSGWFEIAVPEGPGETRVVNLLVICYRSAALGQKPTAHGEVYEL